MPKVPDPIDPRVVRALFIEGDAVREGEPMSRHTTLRIGGPADVWVEPSSTVEVQALRVLCRAQGWPCFFVGGGSNLLVLDGGIRGVVVTTRRLRRLEFAAGLATAGAGVPTAKLLDEAARRSLGGLEFLAGVPGTVGGGLRMNAGTNLGEFRDVTTRVRTVDECGRLVERPASECGFRYRGSGLREDEVIVEADFSLRPRPVEDIEVDVLTMRERRRAREPQGQPNAGSIFKNPPGDFAGRLIEAAGLKGARIGDALVSPTHANWIVNAGQATARDMLSLIDRVRETVVARFNLILELELRILGES